LSDYAAKLLTTPLQTLSSKVSPPFPFPSHLLPDYASKPQNKAPVKPTGLAAKQFEKQMSKKIVIEDEAPEKMISDLNV